MVLVPKDEELLVLVPLLLLGLGLPLLTADCLCVDCGCCRTFGFCDCGDGLGRFPAGLSVLAPLCFIMPFEAEDDDVSVVVVFRPFPPPRTLVPLTALP